MTFKSSNEINSLVYFESHLNLASFAYIKKKKLVTFMLNNYLCFRQNESRREIVNEGTRGMDFTAHGM